MSGTDRATVQLAGLTPGLYLTEPTTGVCRSGDAGFRVGLAFSDRLSREVWLGGGSYAAIAIGGPVLPAGVLNYAARPCEKLFSWEPFRRRARYFPTHVGERQSVRRAGCDTAQQWASAARKQAQGTVSFPRVYPGVNLVEAFPAGFMATMLPESALDAAATQRGGRDSLFDACAAQGLWHRLHGVSGWRDRDFWAVFLSPERSPAEREAMVCLLTAACVWASRYVAVGEPDGGYVFMPPWPLWQPWAREALDHLRLSARLPRPVDVWIDGACYGPWDRLPVACAPAPRIAGGT